LSYTRYAKYKTANFYISSLLLLLLSLLTKPTAITAPLLFLLLDFWPLNRLNFNSDFIKINIKLLYEKLPFLFLSFIFAVMAVFAQNSAGGLKSISSISITDRLLNSSFNLYLFIEKIFWPQGLAVFYPHVLYDFYKSLLAFFVILFFSTFLTLKAKRLPYLFFAWFWLVIASLPVIGLVQIGGQAIADRWTYLPHVGFLIGLFFFVNESIKEKKVLKLVLSVVALVVILIWTKRELKHWKDSETIYLYAIQVTENNFMAHNNLGVFYDQKNDFSKAEYHFEKAVGYAPSYPEALNNLGSIRAREQRWEEAKDLFKKALSVNPNHQGANYHLKLLYSMRPDLNN
jgi:tetratricopeptide (TPR) repeat protein